jgi:hypothetical protein
LSGASLVEKILNNIGTCGQFHKTFFQRNFLLYLRIALSFTQVAARGVNYAEESFMKSAPAQSQDEGNRLLKQQRKHH